SADLSGRGGGGGGGRASGLALRGRRSADGKQAHEGRHGGRGADHRGISRRFAAILRRNDRGAEVTAGLQPAAPSPRGDPMRTLPLAFLVALLAQPLAAQTPAPYRLAQTYKLGGEGAWDYL